LWKRKYCNKAQWEAQAGYHFFLQKVGQKIRKRGGGTVCLPVSGKKKTRRHKWRNHGLEKLATTGEKKTQRKRGGKSQTGWRRTAPGERKKERVTREGKGARGVGTMEVWVIAGKRKRLGPKKEWGGGWSSLERGS